MLELCSGGDHSYSNKYDSCSEHNSWGINSSRAVVIVIAVVIIVVTLPTLQFSSVQSLRRVRLFVTP